MLGETLLQQFADLVKKSCSFRKTENMICLKENERVIQASTECWQALCPCTYWNWGVFENRTLVVVIGENDRLETCQ